MSEGIKRREKNTQKKFIKKSEQHKRKKQEVEKI